MKKQPLKNKSWARWFSFAHDDIRLARAAVKEELPHFACFHAQQAVEKAFKGYMVAKTGTVRKVHDLLELLDAISSYKSGFIDFRAGCEILNRYYNPVRYPDAFPGALPEGLPDERDAKEAIQIAEEILTLVEATME